MLYAGLFILLLFQLSNYPQPANGIFTEIPIYLNGRTLKFHETADNRLEVYRDSIYMGTIESWQEIFQRIPETAALLAELSPERENTVLLIAPEYTSAIGPFSMIKNLGQLQFPIFSEKMLPVVNGHFYETASSENEKLSIAFMAPSRYFSRS